MAVLFLAVGEISPEPLDHPQWLMAGSWLAVACYSLLIGLSLPVLCLYGMLLYALRTWGFASYDSDNPLGPMCIVIYPLMQGVIYGGAAWGLTLLGNVVRAQRARHTARRRSIDAPQGDRPAAGVSTIAPKHLSQTQTNGRARTWMRLFAASGFVLAASIAVRFVLLPAFPPSWTTNFDRQRYVEFYETTRADKHRLLGRSFEEVSRQFGLEHVPWDDASFQNLGSYRIYHFRGFAFHVLIDRRLPDDSPLREKRSYTGEDFQRYGVMRLVGQCPFVRADGLDDPKERMKRYWAGIARASAEVNAQMEREQQRTAR